jgi:hypothetical protein
MQIVFAFFYILTYRTLPPVLDLHLYPLHIKDSVEQAYLPGLFSMVSPKNCVRSRQGDQIILLLSSIGEQILPSNRLAVILENSARAYYRTSGTVTTGIKKSIEVVNDALLEYNLKESAGSKQQSCMINIAVQHENRIFIAHSGYTHSFVLNTRETQHFFDPEGSGRGLGLSRTFIVRFFLSEIASNEYFIFSPEPLATWTPSNLGNSPATALDYVRRRLLNQVSPNIRALLVQVMDGSGKIILEAPLSQKTAYFASPAPAAQVPQPVKTTPEGKPIPAMATPVIKLQSHDVPLDHEPAPRPALVTGQTKVVKPLPIPSEPDLSGDDVEPSFTDGLNEIRHELALRFTQIKSGFTRLTQKFQKDSAQTGTVKNKIPQVHLPPINTEPMKRTFAILGQGANKAAKSMEESIHVAGEGMGDAIGSAVDYVTPEGGFKLPQISSVALLVISVTIPLFVVAIGSSIYFNRGRNSQFQTYYEKAQEIADQAEGNKDPEQVKAAWQQAIVLLDQAEKYSKNAKSITLRKQAQDVLDDVDGISRIAYSNAITEGLPSTANIVKMESTTTDLYMLDKTEGKIYRALMTGRGYEVDASFKCAPGPYGSYTVDPFIDMAMMPKGNSLGASIAAIDDHGNIIYCSSGSNATSMTLTQPETGWGEIKGMAIDSGKLYVLDPKQNTIWVFYGNNGTFSQTPELFFDKQVPTLDDIIDFSISGNDLYILHQDGHINTCTFSDISGTPTKCKDPVPYVIKRPGVENQPVVIPGTNFTHIQYSSPPDPSLYLLDAKSVAIYHFSLKLSLQKQLSVQAGDPLGMLKGKPTAFSINPAKILFIAFGNKIYTGMEP